MASSNPIRITFSQLTIIIAILLVIVGFFLKPLYVIYEGEQAVITRFGQIISIETQAGLKYKMPIIDEVTKYSKKILSWDGDARRIPTLEKQFIWVDTTARWKISDPKIFYSTIKTENRAFSRLDDLIESAVRTTISQNNLVEAVRNTNNILDAQVEPIALTPAETQNTNDTEAEDNNTLTKQEENFEISQREILNSIEQGRRQLSRVMLVAVQNDTKDLGIEVIDIVIRQIRYSDDLTESVYNRMISERKQRAQIYRSDGEGRKRQWMGQLERDRQAIISEAYAISETIKGEADAEAATIYANSYNQDAEFYNFWKAMESYRTTVPNMKKVLSTDLEYFEYLYDSRGR